MWITNEPFEFGGTENLEIEIQLAKWLHKTFEIKTVFDIGAQNSEYPNIFTNASVYLFEPFPDFYNDLVAKYTNRSNVTICPYGLGNEDAVISYYPNTQSFTKRTVQAMSIDPIELPIRTACNVVGDQTIDFMKIDVEGQEYEILKNLESHIRAKKINFIQFEIGGTIFDTQYTLQNIFDIFDDSWTIYSMQHKGILNKLTSAPVLSRDNYGNGNLFATHISLENPKNKLQMTDTGPVWI